MRGSTLGMRTKADGRPMPSVLSIAAMSVSCPDCAGSSHLEIARHSQEPLPAVHGQDFAGDKIALDQVHGRAGNILGRS
jgi:hypothetical protein